MHGILYNMQYTREYSGEYSILPSKGLCILYRQFDRKAPPPPGGFPIYYVPSSRTVCKRTPLEGFAPGASRGVLLHTVLDEGT